MPPYAFDGFWVHFIVTTYGAWLYGDERGFRTRHHREHVDGDYKNPPPRDSHRTQRERSHQLLKQQPVVLDAKWRTYIGTAVRTRLVDLEVFVLCLAQSRQHLHLLGKLPTGASPRKLMGLAKMYATFAAKRHGWQGSLWGKRGREVYVNERRHQQNAYRYILAHGAQDAYIWDWRRDVAGDRTATE